MKTWLWVLLVAVIGLTVGVVAAVSQMGGARENLVPPRESSALGTATTPAPAVLQGVPKVAVDAEVYDFGTMDAKDEKEHVFVFRNTGKAPLKIEDAGTSCKCAISDFKTKLIDPGGSAKVTLKWHARDFFGPYEWTAKIRTNDLDRPEITLKVKGRVTTPLRAFPPEVVFSDVAAGQTAQTSVRLWAYKSDRLQVTSIGLRDPQTAKFFEITSRQLAPEQLREEDDAKSGYELGILLKPGLPLGRFQQTILCETNLPESPRIEVPIKGKIGSDISIVGRGWDEERQCLRLGILKRTEKVDRTLLLVVRGRYRRAIDIEIAEVFPPKLVQAELGEKTNIGGGVVVRVPLAIHISTQAGSAYYLGSKESPTAHVLLNTNHPLVPQIKIPISFAVEGQ